jgi:hypothetical protein
MREQNFAHSKSTVDAEPFKRPIELTHLIGVASERPASVRDGGSRLFGFSKHLVGAYEPDPAIEIGPIGLQSLGEPVNHAANHRALLVG